MDFYIGQYINSTHIFIILYFYDVVRTLKYGMLINITSHKANKVYLNERHYPPYTSIEAVPIKELEFIFLGQLPPDKSIGDHLVFWDGVSPYRINVLRAKEVDNRAEVLVAK